MSLLLLFGGQPSSAQAGGQIFTLQCDDDLLFDDQPDLLRIPLAPRQDSTARIVPANRNRTGRRGAWLGSVPIFRHTDAPAAPSAPTLLTLDDFLLFDESLVKTQYDTNADSILSADDFTKAQYDTNDDSLDLSDAADEIVTAISVRTTAFARIWLANTAAGRGGAWRGTVPISRTLLPTEAPPPQGQLFTQTVDDFLLFYETFDRVQQAGFPDTQMLSDGLVKYLGVIFGDNILSTDDLAKLISKISADNILFTDLIDALRTVGLLFFDNILSTDDQTKLILANRYDDILFTDALVKLIASTITDSFTLDDATLKSLAVALVDNILFYETITKAQSASQPDSILSFELLDKVLAVNNDDNLLSTDDLNKTIASVIADLLWLADTASAFKSIGASTDDFILFSENLEVSRQSVLGDTILFTDELVRIIYQFLSELLTITDTVQADFITGILNALSLNDVVDLVDRFTKQVNSVIGDDILSTDELIKALQGVLAERVEFADTASANKVAGVSASDTLLLVTDFLVKQLQAVQADTGDLSDALSVLLKRIITDGDSPLSDEFAKELLARFDFDRAALSDSATVNRILTTLLQDNLALKDEMTSNLGIVLGDDFANEETLVKIISRIILEDERWTDDIVASFEVAVVHLAEYLAKSVVDINTPERAEAGTSVIGKPEVGARRKAAAAPSDDDTKPKVGARQKVRN